MLSHRRSPVFYDDSKNKERKHMERRPLPIGIDNFRKIIAGNYYYIDKTWMIKELLDI